MNRNDVARVGNEPAAGRPTDDHGGVKELRLALVCYGGVSLAVYMHGVTQELHRLVLASSSRRDISGTASIYRELLATVEHDEGVQTRVVIDIVAGTSAGGINGVSLARALATDGDLAPIRRLWMEHADIEKLLEPGWPKLAFDLWPAASHVPALRKWLGHAPSVPEEQHQGLVERLHARLRRIEGRAVNLLHLHKAPSVLRGEQLSGFIDQGLRAISTASTRSLIPPGHQLDLFVTMTDLVGYVEHVPLGTRYVSERGFRNVVRFSHYEPHRDRHDFTPEAHDFGDACTHVLGFSGRASSSFPGAFEPVSLDSFAKDVTGHEPTQQVIWTADQLRRFFRSYILRWRDAADDPDGDPNYEKAITLRRFVDGGVLDNYPFDHAIEAIRARRADLEVSRRVLLYLEPDPMAPVRDETAVDSTPPSMLTALKAAGTDIPLSQPILEELRRVGEMNDAAAQLRQVVAAGPSTAPGIADAEQSPPGGAPYLRFRLDEVGGGLAKMICLARRFPSGSNQATATALITAAWIDRRLGLDPRPGTDDREALLAPGVRTFLAEFDMGFQRRRLRFIVDGVIALYSKLDAGKIPGRAELDGLKRSLYDGVTALDRVSHVDNAGSTLNGILAKTFDDTVSRALLGPPDVRAEIGAAAVLHDRVEKWLDDHPVDDLLAEAHQVVLRTLSTASFADYADGIVSSIRKRTEAWEDADARAALDGRLGDFEPWDRVVHPIRMAYDVGENDIIELARLSPHDARLLAPKEHADAFYAGKIKGAAYHHFGAFFEKPWRENDYLWGRLDAAERLVRLVLEDHDEGQIAEWAVKLFKAIRAEESPNLTDIPETFELLDDRIASISPG